MIRLLILPLGLLAGSCSLLGDEVVPLSAVKLDYSRIPAGPTAYGIAMIAKSETSSSTMTFHDKMTIATKAVGDAIAFDETMDMWGMKFSIQATCQQSPLFELKGIKLTGKGRGGEYTLDAVCADGRMALKTTKGERTLDFPADTVTFSALLRTLPLMPRDAGRGYGFSAYCDSLLEPGAVKPTNATQFILRCVGPAEVQLDGKQTACTRFEIENGPWREIFFAGDTIVLRFEGVNGQLIIEHQTPASLQRQEARELRDQRRESKTKDLDFDALIAAIRKEFPDANIKPEVVPEQLRADRPITVIVDNWGSDKASYAFTVSKFASAALRRNMHLTFKDNPDHIQDGVICISPRNSGVDKSAIEKMRKLWTDFCPE